MIEKDEDILPSEGYVINPNKESFGSFLKVLGGGLLGVTAFATVFTTLTSGAKEVDKSMTTVGLGGGVSLFVAGRRHSNIYKRATSYSEVTSRKREQNGSLIASGVAASVATVGLGVTALQNRDSAPEQDSGSENSVLEQSSSSTTASIPNTTEYRASSSPSTTDGIQSSGETTETTVTVSTSPPTTGIGTAPTTTISILDKFDALPSPDRLIVLADGSTISIGEIIDSSEIGTCELSIDDSGAGLKYSAGEKASDDIRALEVSLSVMGFFDGEFDGVELGDTAFENALNTFEEVNGFPPELLITTSVCYSIPWLFDGDTSTPYPNIPEDLVAFGG